MASCICGQNSFIEGQYLTCNNCRRYIHLECAHLQWHQVTEICVFYCHICRPYTGPSIQKTITNSHRHNRNEENSELLPIQTGTPDFVSFLKKNLTITEAKHSDFRKMRGQQLTLKELVISGFDKPIQIETKDGLEILTEPNFNFDTILQYYPSDYIIEATEVTRQIKVKMKLSYLLDQFKITQNERQDVYSFKLDMSQNNKIFNTFSPPRIVRKLSWVDQYWPNVPFKPLFSKYCSIKMENSYTDFHIDVGGVSAWYHIMKGEQIFYLIEPTENNLNSFKQWIKSSKINETMFFTNAEKMYKIKVSMEETIFIPNGWIYAILSTQDTMAFCGYFLHSLNISTQLKINDYLQQLNITDLNFPSYELTNWYAAPNIIKLVKESFKNRPPQHLSEGIETLIEKLRYWLQKSKRKENQTLVPKAVNCSKIIRDLNRCLLKSRKKASTQKDNREKEKPKSKLDHNTKAMPEKEGTLQSLDHEEAKIKDLLKNSVDSKPADSGSSNLKITFNMKLAQDVIRRSLDDPYDLDSEANVQELMLDLNKIKKPKKRKHKDEEEINKMIEGRPQDENYIYLDLETPEENQAAIKKSDDDMWKPGTSTNKAKAKKAISSSASGGSSTSANTKPTIIADDSEEKQRTDSGDTSAVKQLKKYKKGLATPKQRLAKKLKMR